MQVVMDEPVPPTRLQPKTPRDLETICLKCLRKEPGRRYATAAELADDLSRFREGRPVLARPLGYAARAAKWVRRRPDPGGAAGRERGGGPRGDCPARRSATASQ